MSCVCLISRKALHWNNELCGQQKPCQTSQPFGDPRLQADSQSAVMLIDCHPTITHLVITLQNLNKFKGQILSSSKENKKCIKHYFYSLSHCDYRVDVELFHHCHTKFNLIF